MLRLDVTGTTDTTTLMNFANHSYWNLDGTDHYDGHRLWIAADHYLPTTPDDYPTGEIIAVDGTDMDFRHARTVSGGAPAFDNNFCLSDTDEPLRDVLRLTGQSGVGMTLATTCPGIQVYDGRNAQRPGRGYYEGLAIEAQHWPDAPNNRHFPSIKVTPDKPYQQTTSWTFRS
jgi:aldose 1-epimerase